MSCGRSQAGDFRAANGRRTVFAALLAVLFVLLAPTLPAADDGDGLASEHLTDCNLTLRATVEATLRQLVFPARLGCREIDSWLGWKSRHQVPLTFELRDDSAGSGQAETHGLLASCPANATFTEFFHGLLAACVRRTATEMLGKRSIVCRSDYWLAAAFCRKIIHDGKGLSNLYLPDYRPVRFQTAHGQYAEFAKLTDTPLPVSETALFRLYCLDCDLLTRIIERHGGDRQTFFRRVFEMENQGRQPSEALTFLLQEKVPAWQSFQHWFEQNLRQESRQGRRINETETVQQQLEKLLTLTVLDAGGSQATRRIPLEDLPRQLSDYKTDTAAMTRLQNELLLLRRDAPPLLQAPLDTFVRSVEVLKSGRTAHFVALIKQGRKEFAEAVARQKQIEDLLKDADASGNSEIQEILDIVDRYTRLREDVGKHVLAGENQRKAE